MGFGFQFQRADEGERRFLGIEKGLSGAEK